MRTLSGEGARFAGVDAERLVTMQRGFYFRGGTAEAGFRVEQLHKLEQVLIKNERGLIEAIVADLGRSLHAAYLSEIGSVLWESQYLRKRIRRWMRPQRVRASAATFPGAASIVPEPYGLSLIVAPWNYPIHLALIPAIGAIAAGNCVVIKPSELSVHTSAVLAEIINTAFDRSFLTVVEGDASTVQTLLDQEFDLVFFTGSSATGRSVLQSASRTLTPTILELGGKNPCIVDETADLANAARRIAWGKFFNAGQTCLAPDHVIVDTRVERELLGELQRSIQAFYGDDPRQSSDYERIISARHAERLCGLMPATGIVCGGAVEVEDRYVAPTVARGIAWDAPLMQEEIFGPILPVICYRELEEVLARIRTAAKPLALYLFTRDRRRQRMVIQTTSSGAVCVNDVMLHSSVRSLPFGGVGESGMGAYHGRASFEAFSHKKSTLTRGRWPDWGMRYPPHRPPSRFLKWISAKMT